MFYRRYVPVSERREKAEKLAAKMAKKGQPFSPVKIEGKGICKSFWGKAWCDHIESLGSFANRLPRGRTYVRNGSVVDLQIESGKIRAKVSGSSLYSIIINVSPLSSAKWEKVQKKLKGQVGSLMDLIAGKLSDDLLAVMIDRKQGIFPLVNEIKMDCSCPDWADLCKHLAAVLYGVGARLDEKPELLFLLRGVDVQDLFVGDIADELVSGIDQVEEEIGDLSSIFGIDIATTEAAPVLAKKKVAKKKAKAKKKVAKKSIAKKKTAPKKVASKKTKTVVAKKTVTKRPTKKTASKKRAAKKKTARAKKK